MKVSVVKAVVQNEMNYYDDRMNEIEEKLDAILQHLREKLQNGRGWNMSVSG